MSEIQVIGVPVDGQLSEQGRALLAQAEVVAAGRRLLDSLTLPPQAERIILAVDAAEALRRLPEERRCVVLASGDPLYYGIGGTLTRVLPERAVRFHPAPTACQEFFARLGRSWEQARLFSVHGHKPVPWRDILRAPLAAILCDNMLTAAVLAEHLVERWPLAASRPAAFGCNLGLEGEVVACASLGEIARNPKAACSLSILALLPGDATLEPPPPLGLPDSEYAHWNKMITHPEVRAVVLAKLACGGGVLWDLGAGSGSVGLEAAQLFPALEIFAVEQDATRYEQLCQNVAAAGLANVHPVHGKFPDVTGQLPPPDRIFVGGGARGTLEWAFTQLRPGGRLVVTAVLAETVAQLCTILPRQRQELLTIQVSRVEEGLFRAENPITIGVFA